MEINRLKPMKQGYSEELFNKIYKETTNLRKSLAYGIDPRYYGVTRDIIESWFDDKFILVFNKHFDNKEPDVLKGFIITSLQRFKNRILRKAYISEGQFYSSRVSIDGEYDYINIIPDDSIPNEEETFYGLCMEFMKHKLSDDAYLLLQTQINPPPYIMNQQKNYSSRITVNMLLDFFDLDENNRNKKYISRLKNEIDEAIEKAREYFNTPLAFSSN